MEETQLYHITCINYSIGTIPPIVDTSHFHQATLNDDRRWINDFLDANRPPIVPSRKRSFYAFDSITNCVGYWSSKRCTIGGPLLYKVKMTNPSKVPMHLVNTLLQKGEGNAANLQIATEYWHPTENWKFYEFLSEEMEVLERVDLKPEHRFNNAIILIGQDRDLAKRLYL